MGLKSGSRDAGLEDDEEVEERQETVVDADEDELNQNVTDSSAEETTPEETTETQTEPEETQRRPTMDSLPYKIRRNKVNEGREQVPYFLREEVMESENELQETLEDILDETVYKSDYREASMVVAQRNPELVAEILREWGYDLDTA